MNVTLDFCRTNFFYLVEISLAKRQLRENPIKDYKEAACYLFKPSFICKKFFLLKFPQNLAQGEESKITSFFTS